MFLTKNKNGFTLIEIMLAMTVFALIMTSVLLSIENISIVRIKTENRIALLEDLYFFSEKLVADIKEGGTIDYEEYWDRQSVGTMIITGAILSSSGNGGGYFSGATGVGNYGSGGDLSTNFGQKFYYCMSGNGSRITVGNGCISSYNLPASNYTGAPQRYGEYALQFWDMNSNADDDVGDEDGNGVVNDDEDDIDLGNGPIVIATSLPELYLINNYEKTRTFFRYIVYKDPSTALPCNISDTGAISDGCMGNVQVLKMRGLDIGYNHSGSLTDSGAFDGKIDTWLLHRDWPGGVPLTTGQLATGKDYEWVDMFPSSINVKSLHFTLFPQKDPWLSWSDSDCPQDGSDPNCISPFIHPYVRLEMTLGFSWGKRRTIKNDDPTISVNTTVSLGDRE